MILATILGIATMTVTRTQFFGIATMTVTRTRFFGIATITVTRTASKVRMRVQ